MQALVNTPAIIAGINALAEAVWPRIRRLAVAPLCAFCSGRGVKWANAIHHGIAGALKGDYLNAAEAGWSCCFGPNPEPGFSGAFHAGRSEIKRERRST